jgi:hypothetical protein
MRIEGKRMPIPGADELMREAERRTALSDWGWFDIRTPLDVLTRAVNAEANLSDFGERACAARLSFVLASRLRMIEDRKRTPGIAQEQIRRPIVIPGLPRSGTTTLLQLLAQDPANRSALTWEIHAPSPPPERASHGVDSRISQVQALYDDMGLTRPEIMAMHPFGAQVAEECIFICEHAMTYTPYGAMWDAPSYAAYNASADYASVFQVHREVLQHLQHRFPAERWVLKAPSHMFHLPAIVGAYPDAVFIQTHRDLGRIIPSLAKLFGALRGLYTDDPAKCDVAAAARAQLAAWEAGLAAMAGFRARPDMEERFVDVHYQALLDRPIETIEAVYERLGLSLSGAAVDRMRGWLSTNAQGRHGAHAYSLAECGLSEADIERHFGAYMDTYGVAREARR